VGPRAGLDAVVKRKIPSTRRESNHRTLIVQAHSLVAIPTELSRLFRFLRLFTSTEDVVIYVNAQQNSI
jgi:hypothetical protein